MLLKHYSLGQDTWHALSLTLLTPVISFFLLSIYWQHYDKLNVLVLVWVFLYLNMLHQSLHYRNALNMMKVSYCRAQNWVDISICIFNVFILFDLFYLNSKAKLILETCWFVLPIIEATLKSDRTDMPRSVNYARKINKLFLFKRCFLQWTSTNS